MTHFLTLHCSIPFILSIHDEVISYIGNLKQVARDKDVPKQYSKPLDQILDENSDVFRTYFSYCPPAKLRPLLIDLTSDSCPFKVRLRNYRK